MEMDVNMVPSLSDGTQMMETEDGHKIIICNRCGSIARLSDEASVIVTLINGKRSIKEIVDVVTAGNSTEYEIDAIYSYVTKDLYGNKFVTLDKESHIVRDRYITVLNAECLKRISDLMLPLFVPKIGILILVMESAMLLSLLIKGLTITVSDSPYDCVIVIICTLIIVLFHEFGHCVAMRKYDILASGIRIGIYMCVPVLYTDTSMSWKLMPDKRLVIDLAGFYFQIIATLTLWNIALLLNISSMYESVAISASLMLLNLNPFIKTDAYWAISDWCKIENLQSKSFMSLRLIFVGKFDKRRCGLVFFSLCNIIMMVGIYSFFLIRIYDIILNVCCAGICNIEMLFQIIDIYDCESIIVFLILTVSVLRRMIRRYAKSKYSNHV